MTADPNKPGGRFWHPEDLVAFTEVLVGLKPKHREVWLPSGTDSGPVEEDDE